MSVNSEGRSTDPMSDHDQNQQPAPNPQPTEDARYYQSIKHVIDTFVKTTVDLSWLSDYSIDDTDALGARVAHNVHKIDEDLPLSELDQAFYLGGIMDAVSTSMAVSRPGEENANLSLLVSLIAQQCYKTGVRDAREERISPQGQDVIAEWVNRKERYLQAMRALYDDIR